MSDEKLYPTVCFGFSMDKEKTVFMQMWVDQWGHHEWRPVPMIEVDKPKRPDAVAGYVEDEDGHEAS